MHGNTAMPSVGFGPNTDYASLWSLLYNTGMGVALLDGVDVLGRAYQSARAAVEDGREGILFDFVLVDGTTYTGMMVHQREYDDDMSVRLWEDGRATEEVVTFDTDQLVRAVYL